MSLRVRVVRTKARFLGWAGLLLGLRGVLGLQFGQVLLPLAKLTRLVIGRAPRANFVGESRGALVLRVRPAIPSGLREDRGITR